ncbi:MAG: hypothetical protein FJX72_09045 [Armatimonadetes bacterium]|nr:hypothetical protein [Armatimonadota bacterium]
MTDRNVQRSTAFIVGVIAAAAGIAVASYLYWWRVRTMQTNPSSLGSVAEILTECHTKMREIQSHLCALPMPET